MSVRRITADERRPDDSTPGMAREEAVATEGLWSGFVRTAAGTTSAWHHHGEFESSIYVVSGTLRFEFGLGGEEAIEAGPGDFIYVPKHAVHRETSHQDCTSIVSRAGGGEVVVNVDGPEPAH